MEITKEGTLWWESGGGGSYSGVHLVVVLHSNVEVCI